MRVNRPGQVGVRRELTAIILNPPAGWGRLFGPVPGRSAKTRCLLCGRSGYGPYGTQPDVRPDTPRWARVLPNPWQARCIAGHFARCEVCNRPFVSYGALRSHQTCKSHHACCSDHTTVPAWANPFGRVA